MADPKAALQTALVELNITLTAALSAVGDPNATPGLIQQALAGVGSAQQKFQAAVTNLPLAEILALAKD